MITQKKIWQRVLPGVVVIAITVLFFVFFMINNNKRVAEQNGNYVSDAAEQTASHIADNLFAAVRSLNNISELCDIGDGNTYPEKLKKVDDFIFSMIDYVALDDSKTITENGNTYYYGTLYGYRSNGAEPDFTRKLTTNPNEDASGEYTYSKSFMLGMQMNMGEAGMLEEFSNLTGIESSMMSFYTSIHADDGTKVGVLIGRYDEGKMKDILATSFFGEASGVFLCNSDGGIITTTDERFILTDADAQNGNIVEILSNIVTDDTRKKIQDSFSGNWLDETKKLNFSFSHKEGTVNACLVQLPLDNGVSADNWIILQTFPATVTAQMQRLANLEGLQLGLGLFFALAIYIGILLILGYFQNKKLVKENTEMTYVVDGLAKLYDRFIYINLNEKKYRYIGDTYPENCEIPSQGDYDDFKNIAISTFVDDYEKTEFAKRLEIEEIKRDMSDGTAYLRYEYRASDSKTRWDDMSLICLSRDENGEAKEILFARQNISELKEKELQNQLVLKEAFRAAEDANKAKSNFLSAMSHDIRTPMNAVLGFSALIEQCPNNPEKVAEYNKKIQSAGKHLIDLINDLLDMSKIESGKFTLNMSKFGLAGLIEEISSVMAPQAKDRGHKFDISVDNGLHDTYLGDKLRISQILINLISNAIKYTPEGGQIDFDVKEGGQNGNITDIVFVVKDNGIGMSEEFLAKIFMPFEREERSIARKVQGTGLGMAITKNLIDLMGGTIDIQSTENVGTTVTIVLHLVTVEQIEQASVRPFDATDNPLEGMNILIAEDNEINAEIINDLLEISGAKCDIAENGKLVVQMFEKSTPGKYDMVFMDIQMPVMNGYEAARALRESNHPDAKTIPIIAMTANAFAEDVKNALDSGMNAHLSKPVSLDAVKAMVEQLKNHTEEK